jgi:hypothetical protein
MPDSYPYIISNNKIDPILGRIRSAARPDRFGHPLLKTWGFTASNDRAAVALLKELGFLAENGTPTELYDRLRDQNDWKYVLGERMRDLYADLYAIDGAIHNAPEAEIKGAMSRVTGKEDESVKRYYATFKTLASLAKFEPRAGKPAEQPVQETSKKGKAESTRDELDPKRTVEYHYNIQIHLPTTTDITVYTAIFKSLKENLGI